MEKVDLRIQRTYSLLHEAFMNLMEEKRFEDITVGELCQRAMIRRTTFYKHFADKYEYFRFFCSEVRDELHQKCSVTDYKENIKSYFVTMSQLLIRYLTSHKNLVQHALESSVFMVLFDMVFEQFYGDYLEVLRYIGDPEEQNPKKWEVTAAFCAGGVSNALYWWFREGQNENVDESVFTDQIGALLEKVNLG